MTVTLAHLRAAQQHCRAVIQTGDVEQLHRAWQQYDEQVRRMDWHGVAPARLRQLLLDHQALEVTAREARDHAAAQRQTVARQQNADRAYRSSQAPVAHR